MTAIEDVAAHGAYRLRVDYKAVYLAERALATLVVLMPCVAVVDRPVVGTAFLHEAHVLHVVMVKHHRREQHHARGQPQGVYVDTPSVHDSMILLRAKLSKKHDITHCPHQYSPPIQHTPHVHALPVPHGLCEMGSFTTS